MKEEGRKDGPFEFGQKPGHGGDHKSKEFISAKVLHYTNEDIFNGTLTVY